MEKFFKRDIQALEEIFAFVDDYASAHALQGATLFAIRFAVEEIFTNTIKYNPEGEGDIVISMDRTQDDVTVRLIDQQAVPFDPTKAKPLDVTLPLEQRTPGGLGIQLVKEMVDRIEYNYQDNKSIITLTFRADR